MYNPAGGQNYTLNGSISSIVTTITLSSFTEPVSGTPYTMSYLNTSIAYGTIGPRTTSSEFISFTGITQNPDGTATLSGVTRGLSKAYPFTESDTFKLPHSGQSIFILSDAPQVFDSYAALDNDNTLSGDNTFSVHSPTIPTESSSEINRAASIDYVNNIAVGGAPDASDTVKGITKLSVAAASPTNPIAVGDNDPRVPTATEALALPGTSGTPSGTNQYVTNDDTSTTASGAKIPRGVSGKIDTGWLDTGTTANQIVELNGSAQIPAVDGSLVTNVVHSILRSHVTAQRVANAASGTQNIAHGLGVAPTYVRITAFYGADSAGSQLANSVGTYDGTNIATIFERLTSAPLADADIDTTHIVVIENSTTSGTQEATITVTSTNIVLAWTLGGSMTADNINLLVESEATT